MPPPVLDVLDNKKLEGAKRAAMVTTALKWLLDHVPALMVPPPMRPALVLLKGLVPYLGYVGGFVAWSWGYIKKFDKGAELGSPSNNLDVYLVWSLAGHGVTLTATWLATVALVPGTWEENDFPKHPKDVGEEGKEVPSEGTKAVPAPPPVPQPIPSNPTPAT